jgi:hypothetical protein
LNRPTIAKPPATMAKITGGELKFMVFLGVRELLQDPLEELV